MITPCTCIQNVIAVEEQNVNARCDILQMESSILRKTVVEYSFSTIGKINALLAVPIETILSSDIDVEIIPNSSLEEFSN